MSGPAPRPTHRRLRAYTFDPSLATQLDTALINQTVLRVPWEKLDPGPTGDYLEVVDTDPASDCFYAPVNLDDPELLATDGLAPSEGNPQFHQQTVYAVAMTTIAHFEEALGRKALWAPRIVRDDAGRFVGSEPVLRLRAYPHALREANAYYSPEKKALLFGYFPAVLSNPGRNLPGGLVFTCLSADVVAHESTHALLDGLHRYFADDSNPDVYAFHEAFADVVALFQHFSQPDALRHQLAKTRGDLAAENLLAQLAVQFGQAIGSRGALRDAIGGFDDKTGKWRPRDPKPEDYPAADESHARGAILVAALFDSFLAIYKSRTADLVRIATGGTGVLPDGALHPGLVDRMAREATRAARHLLRMAIRALDYCPPVDITFGEYLRALVTADYDVSPDDAAGYRVAVIEAFRRRGIYPPDVRTLAADALRWEPPPETVPDFADLLDKLKTGWWPPDALTEQRVKPGALGAVGWHPNADRETLDQLNHDFQTVTWWWVKENLANTPAAAALGLELGPAAPGSIRRGQYHGQTIPVFEVHSVRLSFRPVQGGQTVVDLVIEITQRRRGYLNPDDQAKADRPPADEAKPPALPNEDFTFRGGCTLLVDGETGKVRHAISKHVGRDSRLARQRDYLLGAAAPSLRATYVRPAPGQRVREPFAMIHRHG